VDISLRGIPYLIGVLTVERSAPKFFDVSCYTPECGFTGYDPKLVARSPSNESRF